MNKRHLFFSLVILFFLFFFLELGVRITQRGTNHPILAKWPILALYPNIKNPEEIFTSVPQDSIEWAPYQQWAMRPNLHSRFYRTNTLGFRGPETTLDKPLGRFRVVVMGGSAAWGFGSTSDENTVAGRLQTILREQLPELNIEVINAGQIGYGSTQELIYFHRQVRALNPDIVLLFDGYNDILADFINPTSGWPLHSDLLKSRFEDSFHPRPFRKDFLALLRQSRLLDFVIRRISEIMKPRGPIKPSINPYSTAEHYLRNILALIHLAAPASVWVALQPVPAITQKPLSPEEIRIVAEKEQAVQEYTHRVRQTYQGMKEGLHSKEIATIDLEGALGTEPELMFADECHFGDQAANRIAHRIAEQWLQQKALIKSPIAECCK